MEGAAAAAVHCVWVIPDGQGRAASKADDTVLQRCRRGGGASRMSTIVQGHALR